MKELMNTHDLRLPDWGPYTKKYIGISHIADHEKGFRFDLSVFPGFYRRKVDVPNVMWESGYHPWEASSDLEFFEHRHQLEWKDQVYTDISFSAINEVSRLIRCECVNQTSHPQNLVLHYMASLDFPKHHSHSKEYLQSCEVRLPNSGVWIDALDYEALHLRYPKPLDHLVPDGYYRSEIRDHGFVNGSGIGKNFGQHEGDLVTYRFTVLEKLEEACVVFRFRLKHESRASFQLKGITDQCIQFVGSGDFQTAKIMVGSLEAGEYELTLVSTGEGAVELDGFACFHAYENVEFQLVNWSAVPEIITGPNENSLLLKYKDIDQYYGITWVSEQFEVREFYCDKLDTFMRHNVHHHVHKVFKGEGDGHYTNVFQRPITLDPKSKSTLYGMVCTGSLQEVEARLREFSGEQDHCDAIFQSAKAAGQNFNHVNEENPYKFSQKLLAATTLTNVVYPVYVRRSFVRHHTPGRWWDSLYTWDSGFIGLGLSELDIERAIDCLNAYLTEVGDQHAAYIHHGSPVPVQHYLFLELWNKTQSMELLTFFYPRLRSYYQFLSGSEGSGSNTRNLNSNLIQTWDYFYNSGGWDDYPPQVHVHQEKLQNIVATASNTSHMIRIAKILRMAANEIGGLAQDIKQYDQDIEMFTDSLQTYSWDEEAGYFGYVVHDENGHPLQLLRDASGTNYNMGLDGTYPLVSGICSKQQEKVILEHLQAENRLWSKIGLSTVDQSAPYFKNDGYWNGAVWMPHQWFYWKTMLDLGQTDFARTIAMRALTVWKEEVETTYNCYEHFIIESGRGAGWHHFGGLSNPILSWFAAYYTPGRVTTGFDVWIKEKKFSNENMSLQAVMNCCGKRDGKFSMIVTMNPSFTYRVCWNEEEVDYQEIDRGTLEITVESHRGEGRLVVERVYV